MKKKLGLVMAVLPKIMKVVRQINPSFREQLKQKNAVVQLRLKDGSVARHFIVRDGRVSSGKGMHKNPEVTLSFHDPAVALRFLKPDQDPADVIHFI
jgi:trimethylamine-N-oxide reductase (cytochrome c)